MDRKKGEEKQREHPEVQTTEMGAKAKVPRIRMSSYIIS